LKFLADRRVGFDYGTVHPKLDTRFLVVGMEKRLNLIPVGSETLFGEAEPHGLRNGKTDIERILCDGPREGCHSRLMKTGRNATLATVGRELHAP
jgi:hypothetical protein